MHNLVFINFPLNSYFFCIMTTMENPTFSPLQRLEDHLLDLNDVFRKHQQYIKMKYEVTGLEMEIIQLIVRDGRKKMKEIGKHFDIKLSTLTSIIDKIERNRFVKRVNSKDDRRVVFLETTRKGERLYEEYSKYIQLLSQTMHQSMESEKFDAFVQGFEKVSHYIAAPESV